MIIDIIYILLALCFLIVVVKTYFRQKFFLHMLQLEGYRTDVYLNWLAKNNTRLFDNSLLTIVSGLLIFIFVFLYHNIYISAVVIVIFSFSAILSIIQTSKREEKKPFVYTKRALRIVIISIAIHLLLMYLLFLYLFNDLSFITTEANLDYKSMFILLILFLMDQLAVVYIIIANLLLLPLEKFFHYRFKSMARNKLKKLNTLVIGITGSYGKTSTKTLLHTILSGSKNALMTPQSYNTPMGICKVINNQLTAEHEVFIVEMGACRRGEIKELCDFTYPQIGILTAIGNQHLEKYKKPENIDKTKYELITSLPEDGLAIFNYDNDRVAKLSDNTTRQRVLRYGIDSDIAKLDIWAENISFDPKGLKFDIILPDGTRRKAECPVLGKHNIYNILAACLVAFELGLSFDNIVERIRLIEPVPHRLQLIPSDSGTIVIDDAFNSNPAGTRYALEVLDKFEGSKKILVTPGMVELGELEYEENYRFGIEAAKVCDIVILVGPKQTKAIFDGLVSQKYKTENIIRVRNLKEVTATLGKIVSKGDVILFENDLPDTYDEDN